MLRKGLLFCGILSSVIYLGTDSAGALRWNGYSYTSQTISELMAFDAPSRPLVLPFFFVYDVLLIAFAFGLWLLPAPRRALALRRHDAGRHRRRRPGRDSLRGSASKSASVCTPTISGSWSSR
jgi:hypothetical protein